MTNIKADSIEEYVGQIDPDRRCTAREVIDLMLSQLGDADERIQWGMAIFSKDGKDITGVSVRKNHYSLYVPNVEVSGEFSKKLGNVDCGKGCIRFKQLEDIKRAELKKLIVRLDRENKSDS